MATSQILVTFLTPVPAAIITSSLTVWLAFKRFKSERHWDIKLTAYNNIMGSLYVLKCTEEDCLSEYCQESEEDRFHMMMTENPERERFENDRSAKLSDAYEFLKRVSVTDAVFLGKKVVDSLEYLQSERERINHEVFHEDADEISSYKKRIKIISDCIECLHIWAKENIM